MKIEIPENKKLVYEMTIPIRWGDMDAMGHVNNTVYFRYLESIRIEWLHALAGPSPNAAGEGPVIVNAFCNFLRQLEYPGDVRVTVYVADPGRSSFDSYHTMERTDQPGVLYAEGGGVSSGELSGLRAEQTRLAAEVSELKALVQRLARELGVE